MTTHVATDVVVELRDVVKAFAEAGGMRTVLRGVDLTVGRREIVAVSGRSGSGKTTLLTLLAGLEQPDGGSIRLFDGDTAGDACSWSELALLPQSLGLLDELTVAENIELPLRLADVADAANPADLMEVLGLEHLARRFPSEVSLGEQQRAALARAAVTRPRLLLADEPISHQNEAWARTMMLLLDDLSDFGTACVLATHNEIAFATAHRVLELRDGQLHPREA
jgi:putative ABC transport system ATP-binding protein